MTAPSPATDLYADFTRWHEAHGNKQWSDQTFAARFEHHSEVRAAGVERGRVFTTSAGLSRPDRAILPPLPGRAMVWHGVRFRTESDDYAESAQRAEHSADQHKHNVWQGWQGLSILSRENADIQTYVEPLPPLPPKADGAADDAPVCATCGAFLFLPAPGETTCHRCFAGPAGPVHCIECDVQLTPERADCNIRCEPCWERLLANQPAYTGRDAS